ncbi:uncharacterized protein LOC115692867 isoform X1 [Syzygium oleosum]|uniref:uncharacterized protein LOC115692867 isoform X1 n=3 Tax=Syzygium oleosum TaxID=219896 RepID=UPI0011D276E8|nr:uncharacterized protein LOC115692867 isoform X1 [Syzygium oleosum]
MMQSKLSLAARPRPTPPPPRPPPSPPYRGGSRFSRGGSPAASSRRAQRLKLVCRSLGDKWKLSDIDAGAVQEQVTSWLSKTQNFLREAASPLVKSGQSRKPDSENVSDARDMGEIFEGERTVDRGMPGGVLSWEAVLAIEQFSRMNGLTGLKMQKIFKALVPESVYNDARNLVEYCCFRFLSRDGSHFHPCLKEPAFQKLIFITMLAWGNPYCGDTNQDAVERASFQGKLVGEEAFTRIAPAVHGVADSSTVHNLYKALADDNGISLSSWLTYVDELLKVHEGRKLYQARECTKISLEQVLCIGSSRKRPVLKWENNMGWPGSVILTDKAIYFEAVGVMGRKDSARLDLTKPGACVEKAKVGPLGSLLFDSAISISCGPQSKTWVLEFVDLGGEMRRDVWHAFLCEVIALHKFIREYGPEESDQSIFHVYGAHKGKERAIMSAINSIARLQALQFMRRLLDNPLKLVQFSYLQNSPYGSVVCQALALNIWGGQLVTRYTEAGSPSDQESSPSDVISENTGHIYDIDGSIYLRKWMRSPSWVSSSSVTFWRNALIKQGLVLSKNLVVADASVVEKAATTCRKKGKMVEKTQATIDAAMLKGIPNNIDLFKEIIFPLTIAIRNFERLRRWEEPHVTISFLACAYTLIFRNLWSYVFPSALIILAAGMLTLKGLKEQGRLGRSFGSVTIRDQPPSNTIQKIIAVKDAMRDVENYLQNLNILLLKLRTIVLAGQPQITTEVGLVLLSSATIMLLVSFKYIFSFLLFDLFTRELDFRKEMVRRFMSLLKERWDMVPAAPVVVLPYQNEVSGSPNGGMVIDKQERSQGNLRGGNQL